MTKDETITEGLKLILEFISRGQLASAKRIAKNLLDNYGVVTQAVDDSILGKIK
jgi:hypothetical protein